MEYGCYGASRDVPFSMVVGDGRQGDAFWQPTGLAYDGAIEGDTTRLAPSSYPVDDDAVALPHHQSIPTYDDVDPLPSSLTPTHLYPATAATNNNNNRGWLAPPLSAPGSGEDVEGNNGAASSREGSSVRGGVGNGHRGVGTESSRATSPRDSAGSRNGSRASIFARKLACRQS